MIKELIIVFVKNSKLGKVKTRLAKTIGDQAAFEVYKSLVQITEHALESLDIDKRIYFSDSIIDAKWSSYFKALQQGADLGERMKNAFIEAFNDGYERVILVGSDLPDISSNHISKGLECLTNSEVVFGPAMDGGYYLIGMTKMFPLIFNNKPWSQNRLLDITIKELKENNISFALLETLNDIDTFEDLEASSFYKSNEKLQQRIQELNA
jgi:rSAM/selenodomain-associated transferase 1